jgi:hypothetical protein
VHVVGRYNDHVFDERSLSYVQGEALENSLPEAIDHAVLKMTKHEKVR